MKLTSQFLENCLFVSSVACFVVLLIYLDLLLFLSDAQVIEQANEAKKSER